MEDQPNLPDDDRIQIRIFTIADAAYAAPDGKLYIHGAGIHQIWQPNIPGPLAVPAFLVLRLYIPYMLTVEPHHVAIRMLTEDREPLSEQDPIADLQNVEVGRAPGTRPGDENSANIVLGLLGLPLVRDGRGFVHVEVDEDRIASLPLRIWRGQPTGIRPGS